MTEEEVAGFLKQARDERIARMQRFDDIKKRVKVITDNMAAEAAKLKEPKVD